MGKARWRARARRYVGAVLPGLRRTAILALGCNAVLEAVRLLGVDGYPWRFKTPAYPLLFLLGAAVIWLLVGLVHAVVGRFAMTAAITVTATVGVAVADHEKVRVRAEPLLPSDAEFTGQLGFVAGMVGTGFVVALVLGAVAVCGGTYLAARRLGGRMSANQAPTLGRRPSRLLRMATAVVCMLGLTYLGGFNTPGNAARVAFDSVGADWRPWSQQRNYLGNGFVGGFLYNLDIPPAAPPPGYDRDTMRRITERYADAAAAINRSRESSLADVNVVMVLSESFSDPLALEGVHLAQDPIPYTRALMARTTSGRMLAEGVGGGTANMEFEAMTGMSMSQLPPQIRSPYQMLVPQFDSFPSAVRWFEQTGHRSVALHPYTTEMYRRRDVYRAFGFDEFRYAATMHHTAHSGRDGYVSDSAAFAELRLLLRENEQPLFVNLVTMQNHMPYSGRYDDPAAAIGPNGDAMREIGHYVRGLTHTDQALRALIGDLRSLDEPTVLLFYGDHQPGSYPESVKRANSRAAMHQTPFLVWANFSGPAQPRPVVSPIHFVDLLMERADAPVPPYYALLHRLRERLPAMDAGMWFGPDGRRTRRHDLSPRAERVLLDYRMVQYDLSVGHRYSLSAMLRVPRH
jgi:hypothetical protein